MKLDYQILLKSPPNLTGWIRPRCTVPSIGSAPGVQCRLLDPPLVYSAVYWIRPWCTVPSIGNFNLGHKTGKTF